MKALLNIKAQPHYRRDAFEKGLQRHGYEIVSALNVPRPGDLYVSWNLMPAAEAIANNFRAAGGKVLVVENGVIGKDANGHQLYSIARDAHHAGTWHVGGPERWDALGIEVKPWVDRDDLLICLQRGIGSRLMAMPPDWGSYTANLLKRLGRKITVRPHPGLHKHLPPLAVDLKQAGMVVIWSSMGGVQALCEGIPVSYFAPAWVASKGAGKGIDGVKLPLREDQARQDALTAVGWYQWTIREIEFGLPFQYLL